MIDTIGLGIAMGMILLSAILLYIALGVVILTTEISVDKYKLLTKHLVKHKSMKYFIKNKNKVMGYEYYFISRKIQKLRIEIRDAWLANKRLLRDQIKEQKLNKARMEFVESL
jgi:hypothetical protein